LTATTDHFNSARALIEAAARLCRASARDWPWWSPRPGRAVRLEFLAPVQLDDLLALKVSIVDKSGFFLGALSGVVIAIGDS
jgi:hypothetical protein